MSEQHGTTAGEPAPTGEATQPGQSQAPAQHTGGIDPAEFQRLQRIEQQYRGAAPLIDSMVKLGIKSPDDINRLHATHARIAKLGVDLDQLEQGMTTGVQRDEGEFDPQQFEQRIVGRVQQEFATREHESAMQQEQRLVEGLVGTLAGENAPKQAKSAIQGIVTHLTLGRSELYPDGHPLAGQLKPLSAEQVREVQTEAEAIWNGVRNPSLGTIAASAHTARAPAAPGGQGPSGESAPTNPKPAYLKPMDQRLARAREIRLSRERMAGPMSGA